MTPPRPDRPTVSIIVPVLNEATRIAATLHRCHRDFPDCEVVVVDGGSTDGTPDHVKPPARLVRSPRGRGRQLNTGAAHSSGEVLWIHHADLHVDPAALGQLRAALTDAGVVGGGLTLRFDLPTPSLKWVAATSNARARRLHWIFGDQAMFVRRCVFDALGGFPDLPLMEDLEMSRRLAATGRTVVLAAASTASARRFSQHGTLRMLAFMQWLKLLYFAGVDPATLARHYTAGPPRLPKRTRADRPTGPDARSDPAAHASPHPVPDAGTGSGRAR